MNQEIKQAWLAALRSGEYTQGRSWLRKEDTYCCLGVLCDLHRKATGGGTWGGGEPFYYRTGFISSSTNLPSSVSEWAGLDYHNPVIQGVTLATYNDGEDDASLHPHTFAEIADLIEQYL